jgi:hypothetical protein
MEHITINTGNQEPAIEPPVFVMEKVHPGKLPEPYDRFEIKRIFSEKGWLYFDLYQDGKQVTANMVVWLAEGETWEQMISFYLQIYQSPPPVSANPPSPPWMATVILPNPAILGSQLVARVEQAIALSISQH